ncbi:magnesium transporter CorA family protein [Fructobacillus sp. M1-13]|uniref:Magnesium transporter CorA family protein n=1 Tax=Fructobacillus papyriferae TaxID=2713171 RepID=A0ABS5QQL6_9LACO|nr:magnesium transporter CorA family protein [Fructobacillus papyriferae]MBS9335132.1 magnesium transporter CorA family protein [Fructobacillus papyriferae]MCD2159198.1 magnesium transporter CorA family protein [Fructobacillus papyriferae]
MIEMLKENSNFRWYHVTNMTEDDRALLVHKHGLTEQMLGYATDNNESVRMEFDPEADEALIILDIISAEPEPVLTRPIGIVLVHGDLFTFAHRPTDYMKKELLNGKVSGHQLANKELSVFEFLISGIYPLMTMYGEEITEINRQRRAIQAQFGNRKQLTKQTNDLLHLQIQMIYLQNSLANNLIMLDQIRRSYEKHVTDDDLDLLDAVRVEVEQARDMAGLAMEVINAVTKATGTLGNRDLNWTMKVLTVYSIVFTIPTVVSGFYGENVDYLPFANHASGWWVTIVIMILLMIAATYAFYRYGFLKK